MLEESQFIRFSTVSLNEAVTEIWDLRWDVCVCMYVRVWW